MQRKRNIRLLIVLTSMLIAIVALNLGGNKKRGLGIDKRVFTLNPETIITDVSIRSNDLTLTNEFSYINGGWVVNDRYQMDASMRDVFFSVLSQMEIRRPLSEENGLRISETIESNGYKVLIKNNGEVIKEYTIGGDAESMETYIIDQKGQVYEMHIPGYQSYIAGIFGAVENDWRDRFVFTLNPVSLAGLEIEYKGAEFNILYDNNQFTMVDGIADSTSLANYVESIVFLQADSFLSFAERDDLARRLDEENPEMTVIIKDITGNSEQLQLFAQQPETPYVFGIIGENTPVLFDARRIKNIYRGKDDF